MDGTLGGLSLDAEQLKAATSEAASLVINAGAGSGKTRVLAARIAHLIESGLAPDSILGVTFTRKAGRELRERVDAVVNRHPPIGTFHSICYRHILNEYPSQLGYRRPISIYDEWLAADVLADILINQGLAPEALRVREPNAVNAHFKRLETKDPDGWIRAHDSYRNRLRSHNAIDYDGMLTETVALLRKSEDVRHALHARWKHILIDEFQDTDKVQMELVNLIDPENLAVVGDDFQGLYSWRGADIGNIIELAKKSEVIRLETNYRSTVRVVDAANRLIKHNKRQLPKNLSATWDAKEGTCAAGWVGGDCWHGAASRVMELCMSPDAEFNLEDVAILCRTNKGVAEVSRCLEHYGVAHKRIVRGDFWGSDVVRRMTYTMMTVLNPSDWAAWSMAADFPRARLMPLTRAKIRAFAIKNRCTPIQASIAQGGDLAGWAMCIVGLQDSVQRTPDITATDLLNALDKTCGWMEHFRKLPGLMLAPERMMERIRLQMSILASQGESSPSEFLEWYVARETADEHDGHNLLTVCTVHAAKGLEWPCVILPGWNRGTFPSKRSARGKQLEEERRVAYVAITRAREACHVIYDSEPSRFVEEARMPQPAVAEDDDDDFLK